MSARRVVVFLVVLFAVLGTAVLMAALAMRSPSMATPDSTVLVFDVPETLDEAEPPSGGGWLDLVRRDRPTVWMIAQGIRHAATDDRIVGMILHVDPIDWGWAKVGEIRAAVQEFRAAGKPVYASLSGGGELEYLLASAAGTVTTPPLAVLELNGLTASALFMRGTFDKVGVTPNFAHSGRYKSGVEAYTERGMTGPSKEALQALLDDHYALLVDSLAAARGLDPDSVIRLLDDGPFGAREALAVGLVDTLLHRAELDSMATDTGDEPAPTLSLHRYISRMPPPHGAAKVALVMAVGTIAEGRSRSGPGEGDVLGAETLIQTLREVRERSSIRAVVLRIDSPGGSAQAADDIWREVKRCADSKPLIVSMSDLAASGGYYIAAPADSIVAEPTTITGSIGAYGGKLNLLGLYRKLGLNVETVSRGRRAEMYSSFKDFSPEEAGRFQAQMDEVYRVFIDRVSEGRHLTESDVDSVGQGRVWTGWSAQERGLVDALGGYPRALEMARASAEIEEGEPLAVEVYPRVERPLFHRLFAEMLGEEEPDVAAALPPVIRSWLAAARFPSGVALTLLPWSIEIR